MAVQMYTELGQLVSEDTLVNTELQILVDFVKNKYTYVYWPACTFEERRLNFGSSPGPNTLYVRTLDAVSDAQRYYKQKHVYNFFAKGFSSPQWETAATCYETIEYASSDGVESKFDPSPDVHTRPVVVSPLLQLRKACSIHAMYTELKEGSRSSLPTIKIPMRVRANVAMYASYIELCLRSVEHRMRLPGCHHLAQYLGLDLSSMEAPQHQPWSNGSSVYDRLIRMASVWREALSDDVNLAIVPIQAAVPAQLEGDVQDNCECKDGGFYQHDKLQPTFKQATKWIVRIDNRVVALEKHGATIQQTTLHTDTTSTAYKATGWCSNVEQWPKELQN